MLTVKINRGSDRGEKSQFFNFQSKDCFRQKSPIDAKSKMKSEEDLDMSMISKYLSTVY